VNLVIVARRVNLVVVMIIGVRAVDTIMILMITVGTL
jgi:hypothetical protein